MNKSLSATQTWTLRIWLLALLAFPIVLWILPADFFDDGAISLCPSQFLFDIECLGCGITRAVMHFHHLEFADAAYFNQLVFLVYPFLVYLWFRWTLWTARRLDLLPAKKSQPST